MDDRTTARAYLSILLAAAFWPMVFLWLLNPDSSWAPRAPALRILLALLLAALSTRVALPGPSRRRLAGWFFGVVVCNIVVQYGDLIGLHTAWHRWLLGLVLSSPFAYLILTHRHWSSAASVVLALALPLPFVFLFAGATPGFVKSRLDTWRERRNKR